MPGADLSRQGGDAAAAVRVERRMGSAIGAVGAEGGGAPAELSAGGLRVALFSGNYNCVRDGANNALNRLAGFLLARGGAVRTYAPTISQPAFPPTGPLASVPSLPLPGRAEYRLALGLPGRPRRDLRRFGPTVVHLSAPDLLGFRAQTFARTLGLPVIASVHTRFETYLDYYGLGFLRPAAERLLARFYRGCDRVLVPSRAIAALFSDWGLGSRIAIWSRGVDRQLFSPLRRDPVWRRLHGFADDELIILFFGRLVHEKGLGRFAEAIAGLRAAGQRCRPLVVGAGPAERQFRQMLGESMFTGHLEGAALAAAVASADILLNPSTTECFGNVNLEAMAAGLAVVSADAPSARALIDQGHTGLLVDDREPEGYLHALLRLHRHPLLRRKLGRAATAASRAYDWDHSLAAVLDAYGRVRGIAPAAATGGYVAAPALGAGR